MEEYIKLGDLKVYQLAVQLCNKAWEVYETFDWHEQKIIGDQFITAIDSVGANIAEGYGRYHYLDRIKFYYNARGSLLESKHWLLLLYKREKILKDIFDSMLKQSENIHYYLNAYIKSCYPKR